MRRVSFTTHKFYRIKKVKIAVLCLIGVFIIPTEKSQLDSCGTVSSPFSVFAEEVKFSANSMSGVAGNKNDSAILTGNAFVATSSVEITADKIEMSGDDFRIVKATGDISGKNLVTKLEFTCGQMLYDRETKIAILKDKVHLVDSENEVVADAEVVEYNQDTDIAILQINITLTQKDNICKGAYAVYRKKEQLLNLNGNAQITQGSDFFRAQEIELNLDTQQITLDGRVRGSVTDERKSEDTGNNDKAESENKEGGNE